MDGKPWGYKTKRSNEQKLKDWRKLLHEYEDEMEDLEREWKALVFKVEHIKRMIEGL